MAELCLESVKTRVQSWTREHVFDEIQGQISVSIGDQASHYVWSPVLPHVQSQLQDPIRVRLSIQAKRHARRRLEAVHG